MPVPSIQNPTIPFSFQIFGGMIAGRMMKIRGVAAIGVERFDVMLVCGTIKTADIGLHLWFRFQDMQLILNHVMGGSQPGNPQQVGLPMRLGHPFELVILCDPQCFNVAVNGLHLTQFAHRIPFQNISHIAATGHITVHLITFEVCQSHGHMAHPVLPHHPHVHQQLNSHHMPHNFQHTSPQLHYSSPHYHHAPQYHQPPPQNHPQQQQKVQNTKLQETKRERRDNDTYFYNFRRRRRRRSYRSGGYYNRRHSSSDDDDYYENYSHEKKKDGKQGGASTKTEKENKAGTDVKEEADHSEENSNSDSGGASDYSD